MYWGGGTYEFRDFTGLRKPVQGQFSMGHCGTLSACPVLSLVDLTERQVLIVNTVGRIERSLDIGGGHIDPANFCALGVG